MKIKSLILPLILGILTGLVTQNPSMGIAVFAAFLMPAIVKLYISYAKNNPNHYWFKRKLYGWGWTPVTWQGWVATLLYIGLIAAFALTIDENSTTREIMFTFIMPLTFLTLAFIRVAYKKGERPRWQWGVNKDDKLPS
jgi:general stress protein CsbA